MSDYVIAPPSLWPLLLPDGNLPTSLLHQALQHTGHSLNALVQKSFSLAGVEVRHLPFEHLHMEYLDQPEAETVAIYLRISDDLPGHAILILNFPEALCLADLLLGECVGTTAVLDEMTISALAETGNIVLSSFLNAVAQLTHRAIRPSPPAVVVDMLATILQTMATAVAATSDQLCLIEADFRCTLEQPLTIRFLLLPNFNHPER